MSKKLNKKQIERFSRQIILKNIGILGQNKITNAKVLIIGMGGLGCPVAEFLTRSGVGSLGIVDHDRISLSNIHRQSLFNQKDLNQLKVKIAKKTCPIKFHFPINVHQRGFKSRKQAGPAVTSFKLFLLIHNIVLL